METVETVRVVEAGEVMAAVDAEVAVGTMAAVEAVESAESAEAGRTGEAAEAVETVLGWDSGAAVWRIATGVGKRRREALGDLVKEGRHMNGKVDRGRLLEEIARNK